MNKKSIIIAVAITSSVLTATAFVANAAMPQFLTKFPNLANLQFLPKTNKNLTLAPQTNVLQTEPADETATPDELDAAPVPTEPAPTLTPIPNVETAPAVVTPPVDCTFTAPEAPAKTEYKARFLAIRKNPTINPGEYFTIQVFVQNLSNVPWFSEGSGCNPQTIIHLGTEKERDRFSPFYTTDLNPDTKTNTWAGPARIKMNNERVDANQIATFTITAKAPADPGIYREFYAPVAEGVTWMDGEALFSVDVNVGNATLQSENADYLTYIQKSANLSTIALDGEKNIIVDLSDQRMYVNIGDTNIRTFPVSTGAPSHPTPVGSFKIFLKQPVRIAGAAPHYIMPQYQMFKEGGYGIHALPSLGNDHGVFWREALNHIGSPRSHGCVRLLPDDAAFMFDFTELGTAMTIQK